MSEVLFCWTVSILNGFCEHWFFYSLVHGMTINKIYYSVWIESIWRKWAQYTGLLPLAVLNGILSVLSVVFYSHPYLIQRFYFWSFLYCTFYDVVQSCKVALYEMEHIKFSFLSSLLENFCVGVLAGTEVRSETLSFSSALVVSVRSYRWWVAIQRSNMIHHYFKFGRVRISFYLFYSQRCG